MHTNNRRRTRNTRQLEIELRIRAEEVGGLSSSATAASVTDKGSGGGGGSGGDRTDPSTDSSQRPLWDDAGALLLRADMMARADALNNVGSTVKAGLPGGKW